MSASRWSRIGLACAVGVGVLAALVIAATLAGSTSDTPDPSPPHLGLVFVAAATLLAIALLGIFVRRLRLDLDPRFPWVVGIVSFVVSIVPWYLLLIGNKDLGESLYRGLRVPVGITQFWDLTLVINSIDCARWGFDIYAENNGCLADPSIYAPGMVWLQYVPFDAFSAERIHFWGVVLMVALSAALLWLARGSSGIGQIVLLLAAVGGPWLLLLERGNIDGVVLGAAVAVAWLVRRKDTWWAWTIAAVILWLVGTWKYYPFAMGLMLLPVLRLRRGWIVLVGYAAAAAGYVLATLDNLQKSSAANSAMIDLGDIVVLGRVPVVARMQALDFTVGGKPYGDVLFWLLAVIAVAWGFALAMRSARTPVMPGMLAVAGGVLFLVAVVYAGFGWGYKATFLLLLVPLVSTAIASRARLVAASSIMVLALIAVCSLVVWNTVLVTTCGVIAAGVGLGFGVGVLGRAVLASRRAQQLAAVAAA